MAKIKNVATTEKKIKKRNTFKTKHYPCSYCSKTFSERAGRDHHMQLHSSERPFSCSLCPHTCKTKKYLAKHVRTVHNPPTSYKCKYCDKMFHYKCILDKHIVIHTNAKPHKCKDCGKGFNSQYSLKTHSLIHKDLKPFKCKFCDYACRDSSTLRKHQERHMGIVTRYDCNICDKRFSKKQTLQFHVAEVHMNVDLKKIPCEQCDAMFRTKKSLSIHIEVKHNRKHATTCEICGLKLSSKYNMNSHLRSHVTVRPYKCAFDGCEKRYKDKSSLQKHSIVHYPEKQFPCKICGKKFTRKERLRKHKKQHAARAKNVQCDHCGVCFYNKNYLSVHILKKHARRKRKFICDLCDFESRNKPGLIKHIKGHNMKTDKVCPICSKTYKQEKWLNIHLWQTHKVIESNSSGIPTFETAVKVEPLDIDATPEFELFEIEKEELLDELHSVNADLNLDDKITEEYKEIQQEYQNILLRASQGLKDNIVEDKNSSETMETENNGIELKEHSSVGGGNDNDSESIHDKSRTEVLSINGDLEISKMISVDNIANTDIQIEQSEVVENEDNIRSSSSHKCVEIDSNEEFVISSDVTEDDNFDQKHETTTLDYGNEPRINTTEQYSETLGDKKQIHNLKEIELKINRVDNSKRQRLRRIKTNSNKTMQRVKKIPQSNDLNNKSNSNGNDLAQNNAAPSNKHYASSIMNATALSESEELEQGLEYSKTVLSEDITRHMTQRKIKNPSEKNFDDFLIQHIVERQEKPANKLLEIDKDSESYAKNYLDKLLESTRNEKELKLIEKTRQQYNERIRKARNIRPEKVSIKYFEKTSRDKRVKKDEFGKSTENNGVIKTNKEAKDINENRYKTDNDERNLRAKNEENCDLKENSNKTASVTDTDSITEDNNTDVNQDNEIETKDRSQPSSSKEFENNNEEPNKLDENKDRLEERERNRFNLRSHSDNKRLDDVSKVKNDEYRKIKLNTHQCYVCFKLFESKEILLDHCKDHFEVCNSTILKKCPLCDFATKSNIVQHMRAEHDVEITIPSTKIIDKESVNGRGYCYKVNSESIDDIEVIPSVKHLNKQAYIAIDKRNRERKDIGVARTKLVKKGGEWIVERKMTNIDNIDEFILPEFNVKEILSVKISSNDYLSRMKNLYQLAKRHKKKMLFPCEICEKICQTMSALKLHYRRHDPESKPFKKKVWKHKVNAVQQINKKVTNIGPARKNPRVVEIDKVTNGNRNDVTDKTNDNRYKKPKPVVNKHKCDPELIKFYETNIKGGDIEFWQFLKIFNKMSRENVNDFKDLNERTEFGIHSDETNVREEEDLIDTNSKENEDKDEGTSNLKNNSNKVKNAVKDAAKRLSKFKRIIRISKRDYLKRNELKQKLRNKIAEDKLNLN